MNLSSALKGGHGEWQSTSVCLHAGNCVVGGQLSHLLSLQTQVIQPQQHAVIKMLQIATF